LFQNSIGRQNAVDDGLNRQKTVCLLSFSCFSGTLPQGSIDALSEANAYAYVTHKSLTRKESSMTQQSSQPNQFDLSGHDMHITFSRTSFTGQPQFGYQGALGSHTVQGDQIRTQESELGTLVSVTLVPSVDAQTVSLTVVLPNINLAGQQEHSFKTIAIQTTHAGADTIGVGARESYEVFHLHGTAKLVMA
jgi:hypothetical protein